MGKKEIIETLAIHVHKNIGRAWRQHVLLLPTKHGTSKKIVKKKGFNGPMHAGQKKVSRSQPDGLG